MAEYGGISRNMPEYHGIWRNIMTFSRNLPGHHGIFRWYSHATVYKHRCLTTYFDYKSDGSVTVSNKQ